MHTPGASTAGVRLTACLAVIAPGPPPLCVQGPGSVRRVLPVCALAFWLCEQADLAKIRV